MQLGVLPSLSMRALRCSRPLHGPSFAVAQARGPRLAEGRRGQLPSSRRPIELVRSALVADDPAIEERAAPSLRLIDLRRRRGVRWRQSDHSLLQVTQLAAKLMFAPNLLNGWGLCHVSCRRCHQVHGMDFGRLFAGGCGGSRYCAKDQKFSARNKGRPTETDARNT